jgi:hypothetical protein
MKIADFKSSIIIYEANQRNIEYSLSSIAKSMQASGLTAGYGIGTEIETIKYQIGQSNACIVALLEDMNEEINRLSSILDNPTNIVKNRLRGNDEP